MQSTKVGFDDRFGSVAFDRSVAGERPVGQHETGGAVRRQVMQEVQNPGVVGVAVACGVSFDEYAAGTAARVEDAALVGFDHLDQLTDLRSLGVLLQEIPASFGRDPENVLSQVFVLAFQIGYNTDEQMPVCVGRLHWACGGPKLALPRIARRLAIEGVQACFCHGKMPSCFFGCIVL